MVLAPAKMRNVSWCVAFVSFCYRKAGFKLPLYFTGAEQLIKWADKNNCLVDDPLPADVETFLYPKQSKDRYRKGHARILTGKEGLITAGVDGNVQDAVRCGLRRDRPDRYYVRLPGLATEHGKLVMPQKLMYLDKLEDR
jgi:hypothetical protein